LRDCVNDIDNNVVKAAILSLTRLGDTATAIKGINDVDSDVRQATVASLGETADPTVLPTLAKSLNDREKNVRFETVLALGNINDRGVMPLLTKALRDRDSAVRWAAASMVGYWGSSSEISLLIPLTQDDFYPEIPLAAAGAIGIINVQHTVPRKIMITRDKCEIIKWQGIREDVMRVARKGEIVKVYGYIGSWYQLEDGWIQCVAATEYSGGDSGNTAIHH